MKLQLSILALFAALAAAAGGDDTNAAPAINDTDAESAVQDALGLAKNITGGETMLDGILGSADTPEEGDEGSEADESGAAAAPDASNEATTPTMSNEAAAPDASNEAAAPDASGLGTLFG